MNLPFMEKPGDVKCPSDPDFSDNPVTGTLNVIMSYSTVNEAQRQSVVCPAESLACASSE